MDNKPYTVPQKIGSMDLSADNLKGARNVLKCVGWGVKRNPAEDKLNLGPLPTLTVDSKDPTKATLGTDAEGSFNIYFFCQPRNATSGSDTKIYLKVFNLVMVKATIVDKQPPSITTDNSLYHAVVRPDHRVEVSADDNNVKFPIYFDVHVCALGGNLDAAQPVRHLGLDKVKPGWFQTATAELQTYGFGRKTYHATALYPTATVFLNITAPPRCLDPAKDEKGNVVSVFNTNNKAVITDQTVGDTYHITSSDGPRYNVPDYVTINDVEVSGTLTNGNIAFSNYIGYHSLDYPDTYAALGQVRWSISYSFERDPATGGWKPRKTGCAVTAPNSIDTTNCPADATRVGAIVDTKIYLVGDEENIVPK